ncbi:MAG: hypothetical protein COV29_02285 [Candidatus Yanofskybacteria bacterium CG10_big_fil_rev_8_21_14_0_10_36_16]|uniref:TIGR00374 family protein n=1 Tax=Candidatus Yanofskybacteria bacterium CG10_big_fil_rev_8_21_14_0_10_36_16 TaxID=1975096 RepID=A0A2J0QBB0_9BACT|nr:MAG: hypothetical protein COV29_02285 [Candidatus Yanofskybacteria bacterium CG10_big_fil_rev_8_21_14_0_10_36_16]
MNKSDSLTENNNNSHSFLSRPRLSFKRFVFYFITLAVLILIYIKFAELQLIGSIFAKSNLYWLSFIIILAVASHYFQALNYKKVLEIKDQNIKITELFPMAFIVQFINHALPSAGLSGQVFFIQFLKKYGMSVSQGLSRALLEIMTLYMAFGTFFIASSVMIFYTDILGSHPELKFFIYAFVLVATVAVSIFLMLQKESRGKISRWVVGKLHKYFEEKKKDKGDDVTDHSMHISAIIDEFKSTFSYKSLEKHPKPFWLAYFWHNMVFLANVFMLYFIAFAIGNPIGFKVAFIVFTLVKFISMVAFVPGALGVFEGGMTLILISFGVPAQPAFAMTLLLRAFTFWFPMPIGWILYKWHFHNMEIENPYDDLVKDHQR